MGGQQEQEERKGWPPPWQRGSNPPRGYRAAALPGAFSPASRPPQLALWPPDASNAQLPQWRQGRCWQGRSLDPVGHRGQRHHHQEGPRDLLLLSKVPCRAARVRSQGSRPPGSAQHGGRAGHRVLAHRAPRAGRPGRPGPRRAAHRLSPIMDAHCTVLPRPISSARRWGGVRWGTSLRWYGRAVCSSSMSRGAPAATSTSWPPREYTLPAAHSSSRAPWASDS